ncbi:uncharacterized protein ACN2A1_012147 [Glossina fuscipes fuscipes]
MNQDGNLEVDDIRMRVNDAVDLGILKKMEKIGIAINFTASSPENTVPAIEDDEPGPSDANRSPAVGPALIRDRGPGPGPDLDPDRDLVCHLDAEGRCRCCEVSPF